MSSNQLDIINVMNYAARLARIESGEVSRFEPRELVQMATIGGAKALDMADKIGSLEAGKLADIIIIETSSPNMQPNYDPYATLVFAAYPSNVVLTMVNGAVVAEMVRWSILIWLNTKPNGTKLQIRSKSLPKVCLGACPDLEGFKLGLRLKTLFDRSCATSSAVGRTTATFLCLDLE